jgi:hypothetical protein
VPFKQGSDVEETHVNERLGTKPKPNEKAPKKKQERKSGNFNFPFDPRPFGPDHTAWHAQPLWVRKGRHFHLSRRFRARRGANGEGRVVFGCVEDDPPTFGMGAERKKTEPV